MKLILLTNHSNSILQKAHKEYKNLNEDELEDGVWFPPTHEVNFGNEINAINVKIFNFYHPSPQAVKGQKQKEKYIKNFKLLWDRITK